MTKKLTIQFIILFFILAYHYVCNNTRTINVPKTPQHITGMIREIPTKGQCFQSFVIETYIASWYSCHLSEMHAGEIWTITAKLKPLMNLNNPGGFDYVSWAHEQNIHATASIISAKRIEESKSIQARLLRVKEKVYQSLLDNIPEKSLANVLAELTLDVREGLDFDTKQLFTLTGTQHLLAISGSHIVLMLAFLYFIFLLFFKPLAAFFRRGIPKRVP